MVAVIAKIGVKEGKADELVQLLKDILPSVKQEEGTLYYTVNRDRTNPNLVVVVEKYKDDAAFAAHGSTPYLAELFGKAQSIVEGDMELMLMDEIASI
jgi:quinol monooxygenase YgiN